MQKLSIKPAINRKRKMPQLADKEQCNGCEACANICSQSCISFRQNKEGFYYPSIDAEKCIDCGMCENTCPLISPSLKFRNIEYNDTLAYGIHHKDAKAVRCSSSGGLARAIAEWQIQRGGKVYGVVYENRFREVVFISAESVSQFEPMSGSKYVLARKKDVYKSIKQDLKSGRSVVFVGLPCEVGGLYAFLRKEYELLTTIELICAGVGSYKVHTGFLEMLETKYHSHIQSFTYRHKRIGWVPNFVQCNFENGKKYERIYTCSEVGIGITKFKRPSCFHCIYKGEYRKADLTIGDFWTLSPYNRSYNHWGTSVAFARTDKGKQLMQALDNVIIYPVETKIAKRSNPQQLNGNSVKNEDYELYKTLLLTQGFESVSQVFQKKETLMQQFTTHIPGNVYFVIKKFLYKVVRR